MIPMRKQLFGDVRQNPQDNCYGKSKKFPRNTPDFNFTFQKTDVVLVT